MLLIAVLALPGPVRANSVQFQSLMTVRPGCSVMAHTGERENPVYLCSPNVGEFRLMLDGGRYGDREQRYLSDGVSLTPYQLQIYTGQGARRNVDGGLSVSLPDNAPTLMLQAIAIPLASTAPVDVEGQDTVLATFEY